MADPSGAGAYAPFWDLTPNQQGGADIVVAYFLIVTTSAFATIRFLVSQQRVLQLDADDITFAAGVLFAILTSIVSHLMTTSGMGRHEDTLSRHTVDRFFKYMYAENMLAVTAMAFAKMSVLLLFRRIMSQSRAVKAFITLAVMIGVYYLFSIFTIAFQCGATRPWIVQPATCPTHGEMGYGIIGFNMLTDVMLAFWILPPLWKLKMSRSNRFIVMSLFAARIIIPCVAVGQMVLLNRALASEDQTWRQLPVVIVQQVVVHLSVIHSTLPRIHGFLAKLQTGLLATRLVTNMPQREGSRSRRNSNAGPVNTIGSSERTSKKKIDNRLFVSSSSYDYPLPEEKGNGYGDNFHPDSINPIAEEAEGNFTDGLRLRPDIMPGTKWSTTIYSDHDSGKERARNHSSSTKGEDTMQMGSRVDEENSITSIYDDHHGSSSSVPPVPGMPASHIVKTKEFRMQVEKRDQAGNLIDVTTRENGRRNLGREMTEV